MSDSVRQELGQIQGILSQIQKNTDKIPELAARVHRHEERLDELEPDVEDYMRTKQRAVGIGTFIAAVFAAIGRLSAGH